MGINTFNEEGFRARIRFPAPSPPCSGWLTPSCLYLTAQVACLCELQYFCVGKIFPHKMATLPFFKCTVYKAALSTFTSSCNPQCHPPPELLHLPRQNCPLETTLLFSVSAHLTTLAIKCCHLFIYLFIERGRWRGERGQGKGRERLSSTLHSQCGAPSRDPGIMT